MISKNTLFTTNLPLNLEQLFSLESLIYHYNSLKTIYLQSESITRNKSIPLPKMIKRVSNKNNYNLAIKLYNRLPNELKSLTASKHNIKTKIKNWVRINV